MIRTPPSFADTPERPAATGPDVLSVMLRAVRLSGAVYLNGNFTAPFGIEAPKQFDDRLPMANLRHVSIFHLIAWAAA